MSGEYEVVMGRRVVATRRAPNAREAAIDYVRSIGCPASELTYLGGDAVAWHGAVYRAMAAVEAAPLYELPPISRVA
jgi:hypothetical protein